MREDKNHAIGIERLEDNQFCFVEFVTTARWEQAYKLLHLHALYYVRNNGWKIAYDNGNNCVQFTNGIILRLSKYKEINQLKRYKEIYGE